MKIDISLYRNCIPTLTFILNKFPNRNICELITEYSVSSFVPLIAVCYYVIEIKGEDPEVRKMIDSLVSFYKYE